MHRTRDMPILYRWIWVQIVKLVNPFTPSLHLGTCMMSWHMQWIRYCSNELYAAHAKYTYCSLGGETSLIDGNKEWL